MKTVPLYDEEKVLKRLSQNDPQAFTEIYNRYHPGVYAYLLDFVKIPSLAEDLVHEVFLKLWEIREKLAVRTSFSSYLYRISRNRAIDMLRKIASEEELRSEIILSQQPVLPEEPAALARLKEYEALLEKGVNALPPQRRKVFLLCRENGRSYDQAALELGISRNTVKEHMVHALRFLRAYVMKEAGMLSITCFLYLIYKVL